MILKGGKLMEMDSVGKGKRSESVVCNYRRKGGGVWRWSLITSSLFTYNRNGPAFQRHRLAFELLRFPPLFSVLSGVCLHLLVPLKPIPLWLEWSYRPEPRK